MRIYFKTINSSDEIEPLVIIKETDKLIQVQRDNKVETINKKSQYYKIHYTKEGAVSCIIATYTNKIEKLLKSADKFLKKIERLKKENNK